MKNNMWSKKTLVPFLVEKGFISGETVKNILAPGECQGRELVLATKAAYNLETKSPGETLDPYYECPYCNFYHVGHNYQVDGTKSGGGEIPTTVSK
jgi:hypothetical protein